MKQFAYLSFFLFVAAFVFVSGDEVAKADSEPEDKEEVTTTNQGTAADRERLYEHLFTYYDNRINPDNLTVTFGLALIDYTVIEEKQQIRSEMWKRVVWNDNRLSWNREEYPVDVLRLDPATVWKPDITLYNSAGAATMGSCWQSKVLLYSNGEILWVPPCNMLSHCELTLDTEPYAEQTCFFKFGSWTFDGFTMDLRIYNDKPEIDLSDAYKNTDFEIVSTTAMKNERYYSCCKEPYYDITFNMTFKRVPPQQVLLKL